MSGQLAGRGGEDVTATKRGGFGCGNCRLRWETADELLAHCDACHPIGERLSDGEFCSKDHIDDCGCVVGKDDIRCTIYRRTLSVR